MNGGKSATPSGFDPSIAKELACPVCRGDLRPVDSSLVCSGCRRAYPILDGIPVLIAEQADTP